MSKATLLLTVAFAAMTTSANARPSFTLSDGNRIVTIAPPGAPAAKFVPGTKYLLTNFATKEPKGTYLSAPFGFTISGPSSTFGEAYGLAEQFALKKSATVTTLTVAIGYVSGDHSFTLTLYADDGHNAPGALLASGTGTTNVAAGTCCAVENVVIASTSLAAKTPYWLAITTTGSNFESDAPEVANQVNARAYVSSTTDGGNTWSAGVLETWYGLPAFGIK